MLKPFHLIAALPFVVSACMSFPGQNDTSNCSADSADHVQAADWARAKTITIRVRRDEFVPMIIPLTQGRPYEFRLVNSDEEKHVFRAPDFFKAIAIESATVGGRELTEGCPKYIVMEAAETAEIRFVAVRDGHYDFKDSMLPISYGSKAIGVIAIDFREAFTIGSLNPVVIDIPESDETTAPSAPMKQAPSGNPFDSFEPAPAPEAAPNPFDSFEPAPAPEAAPKPFDSFEPAPAPEAAPNPFDAVEPAPAPEAAPNPFDVVEPAPAPEAEPNPFETVDPAPAPEAAPDPFEAAEPAPAEVDAPGPMVQAKPPGEPAPPPQLENEANPFAALEPDRSLPME